MLDIYAGTVAFYYGSRKEVEICLIKEETAKAVS